MDQMLVCPQNSYVKNLILSVTVVGSGASERWLGQEGGLLTNELMPI